MKNQSPPADEPTPCRHLVITVHGIRTFGDWQGRLQQLLCHERSTPSGMRVVNYRYGYFSVIAFLIPFVRWLVVRQFRSALEDEYKTNGFPSRLDIVAHSFGTHLVAWGLMGIPKERRPKVHTIILAGSVLKVGFSWRELMDESRVYRVINECGIRDSILLINQLFVLFTGMAGRVGFNGMEDGERFLNRYYAFGHSEYFEGKEPDLRDDFMRQNWVPLLLGSNPPSPFDARRPLTPLRGLTHFLLNNAEPVKLALYVSPFILLTLYINGLRHEAVTAKEVAEEERRLAEHNLVSSYLSLADAAQGRAAYEQAYLWYLQAYSHIPDTDPRALLIRRQLAMHDMTVPPQPWKNWQHDGAVYAAAFSPDGKVIATGVGPGARGTATEARLWDACTGKPLIPALQHESSVSSVAFSADGKTLLTATLDNTVQRWDAQTGERLATPLKFHVPDDRVNVAVVTFSPDGKTFAAGYGVGRSDEGFEFQSGEVQLWDVRSGNRVGKPLATEQPVRAVAFSPDGTYLLTGCGDTAQLWNADSGEKRSAPIDHGATIYVVAFSPDGRTVLTAGQNKTIRLWDSNTGKQRAVAIHNDEGSVNHATFSTDGETIVSSNFQTVRFWDAQTLAPRGRPLNHALPVRALAISPDGQNVITGYSVFAQLWVTESGPPPNSPLVHQNAIIGVEYSPDGKSILTGSAQVSGPIAASEANLWGVPELKPRTPPLRQPKGVYALAYSPDGKMVVTGSADTAQRWDAQTGEPIGGPVPHRLVTGLVNVVAFSPDGKTFLTGNSTEARFWDAKSGEAQGEPLRNQGGFRSAAFSSDGRIIATGHQNDTVQLWDAETRKPRGPLLQHKYSVNAVAFSPDGKILLTGSGFEESGESRLWDIATGAQRHAPVKHSACVYAVAFSADGETFATGSGYVDHERGSFGEIRLWDTRTGKLLGAPFQNHGCVYALAFSPDGQAIVSGHHDKMARVWNLPPPAVISREQWQFSVECKTGLTFDEEMGDLRRVTLEERFKRWAELHDHRK